MPKTSSNLYKRTKSLLTPPSSPPTAVSTIEQQTSPSSSSNSPMGKTSSIIAHSQQGESGVVDVPKSEWKQPKKIGYFESWWIFYEGMFAGSMLEVWEKVLLHSLLVVFLTLLALAASYLPGHLRVIASHARYYAYGTGPSPVRS
ncbi:hypothetical protein JCM5353_003963 [Sporobolomyces roseus]